MIEVTPELIDRYAELMSNHAGYAVSRNTERILLDLVKQAEITERSASSIPVTLNKMIHLHGQIDRWYAHVRFTSTVTGTGGFVTAKDYGNRRHSGWLHLNNPANSDSESEKDPSGLKELLDGEQFLKTACSTNLEGAANAQAMKIFAPLPSRENRVAIYASGSWKTQIVPNVKSVLEAVDDGNNIVVGPDGLMTHQTMISLSTSGFGIVAVYRTLDGHLLRKESMDGVTFVEHEDLDDNEKDRRYLLDELKKIMENDDCILMFQAEFYGFDRLK